MRGFDRVHGRGEDRLPPPGGRGVPVVGGDRVCYGGDLERYSRRQDVQGMRARRRTSTT